MKKVAILSLAVVGMASANVAYAKTCELTIEGNDQMQFSKKELTVEKACTEVKLTMKHTGKLNKQVMGHNWILVNTADKDTVVADALKAGAAKDYIPEGSKVLAKTKTIGGGESATTTFSTKALKAGGDYTYICTFPGHSGLMVGKLIFK